MAYCNPLTRFPRSTSSFGSLRTTSGALLLFNFAVAAIVVRSTTAFVVGPTPRIRPTTTALFLENWVADMIDEELWRQGHKKEFEGEWMRKNKAALVQSLNPEAVSPTTTPMATDLEELKEFMQHKKDVRLAHDDPQRYCADRCISTGNCDVYEDFFHLSATEVVEFCKDCVLGDGEEPCDIPDAFYDEIDNGKLLP